MTVDVQWLVEPAGLDDGGVRRAVEAALEHGGRAGIDLSVAMVDDPTLAGLHAQCLDDPSVTDVMSFLLGEGEDGAWGEVVVSVDRAREVAAERGLSWERELVLYAVHGTLHLCGFDDHEEADRVAMRAAEAVVLGELGFPAE